MGVDESENERDRARVANLHGTGSQNWMSCYACSNRGRRDFLFPPSLSLAPVPEGQTERQREKNYLVVKE